MATPEAAIIKSYQQREKAFILDASNEELGQKNRDETDYNRTKISQRDLGSLSVLSSLSRVQYGKWKDDPACLIGMRFQFLKGNAHLFRFKEVEILTEFTARPVGDAGLDPAIVDYGPRNLRSEGSTEERKWHYKGKLSATVKAGPVEIGPDFEGGKEGKYTRQYFAVVEGSDWGDRKHRLPNCAKFWLREDEKQTQGVPLELLVAIVFRCRGPSQVMVDVRVDSVFQLLAWPWTKDDPVLLEPGVEYGDIIREGSADFSTLTQEEWRQLVTPDLKPKDKLHNTE